ncbi:MAG: hypothetical protein NTY45_09950, partial [Elusimicrobia bacterium]|nr:hypothetical protein [Elusimicrobiota bacterium]
MEFKITNADGSVVYWTSGSTGVYVSAGLFRYPLGTPNEAQFAAIPWAAAEPYVRVTIDGTAMSADPLLSTPYALHAGTAEGSAGGFTLADGDLKISTTTGSRGIIFQDGSVQYTAAFGGVWVASGADVYNSNTGNVGIGLANPSQKLEVAGTVKAAAFQGDGTAVSNITAANIAGGSLGANVRVSSIAVGAINNSNQIVDGTIIAADIAASTISLNKLNQSGCTTNQIPKWNGSAWACSADADTTYTADEASLHKAGTTFSALNSSVTLQGNSFNTAGKLVLLDGSGSLPALNGSALTNVNSAQFGSVAAATTTIAGNLASEISDRGNADSALSGRLDTVVTDTGTLKSQIDLKAPLASPTFTGTVGGITPAMVGLGNVDNTSDANKPVSTAQQAALNLKAVAATVATDTGTLKSQIDLKAPLASPTFTGTVGGITPVMVGLGNVDNTSDANKPVSTAQLAALNAKAVA